MKICIACDHAGHSLKTFIKSYFEEQGKTITDFGSFDSETVDYPDTGFTAAKCVAEGKADFGILICSTGNGMNIVANKVKGIRACLCHNIESARLARSHNNGNILVLAAKFTQYFDIVEIIEAFLKEPFTGEERHIRRLNKITDYESKS